MLALPGRDYYPFHDPEYWREHPEELRKAFYERVGEESMARPAAWLLAIWLLFGFIYALSGLIAAPGLATALQLLAGGLVFSGSVVVLMLLLRTAPVVAAWGYIAWAESALALLIYAVFLPTIMRRIWRLVKA